VRKARGKPSFEIASKHAPEPLLEVHRLDDPVRLVLTDHQTTGKDEASFLLREQADEPGGRF